MKTIHEASAGGKRPYRQSERAEASARTAEAILDAFSGYFETMWFDEITLNMIAEKAGVTVPTILRHYGSKQGLIPAIQAKYEREIDERRDVNVGDIRAAITALIDDYETVGDQIMRQLAQEERVREIKEMADYGRAEHRIWIQSVFTPWLDELTESERDWRTDQLVAVLDVYVWKLLRRDRGRSRAQTALFMEQAVKQILGVPAA